MNLLYRDDRYYVTNPRAENYLGQPRFVSTSTGEPIIPVQIGELVIDIEGQLYIPFQDFTSSELIVYNCIPIEIPEPIVSYQFLEIPYRQRYPRDERITQAEAEQVFRLFRPNIPDPHITVTDFWGENLHVFTHLNTTRVTLTRNDILIQNKDGKVWRFHYYLLAGKKTISFSKWQLLDLDIDLKRFYLRPLFHGTRQIYIYVSVSRVGRLTLFWQERMPQAEMPGRNEYQFGAFESREFSDISNIVYLSENFIIDSRGVLYLTEIKNIFPRNLGLTTTVQEFWFTKEELQQFPWRNYTLFGPTELRITTACTISNVQRIERINFHTIAILFDDGRLIVTNHNPTFNVILAISDIKDFRVNGSTLDVIDHHQDLQIFNINWQDGVLTLLAKMTGPFRFNFEQGSSRVKKAY